MCISADGWLPVHGGTSAVCLSVGTAAVCFGGQVRQSVRCCCRRRRRRRVQSVNCFPRQTCCESVCFRQLSLGGYHGGSPTAVQALQPCPLWEPSSSHPYYCRPADLLCLFVYPLFVYYFVCVCICVFCVFFVFFGLFSFVAFFFSTLILLVGSFF